MRKLFSIIYTAALLCSCNNYDTTGAELIRDEVEVDLSIVTTSSTRAVINDEQRINNLYVLVFDASSADSKSDERKALFKYYRHAWLKEADTYHTVLKTGNDLNIYFAANIGDKIEQAGLIEGDSYETVREKLLLTNPQQIIKDNLPMWGIIQGQQISESSSYINLGKVILLRAVASADIDIDKNAGFDFIKAYVVCATTKGYSAHRKELLNPLNGQISAPEVPVSSGYDAGTDFSWSAIPHTNVAGNDAIENTFYMFDNDATEASAPAKRYTKLIVEGKYGNASSATFYPLAFRNTAGDKVQVARNRKFEITVTEVNGDGYPTIEEALDAEEVNMQYEVLVWDNGYIDSDIIIDGRKYVSFSAGKTMLLADLEESTALLYLSTNAIEWNSGASKNVSMSLVGFDDLAKTDQVSNKRFQVKLEKDSTDPSGESYYLKATALADYKDALAGNTVAILRIEVDRIRFEITLKQMDNHWSGGENIEIDL